VSAICLAAAPASTTFFPKNKNLKVIITSLTVRQPSFDIFSTPKILQFIIRTSLKTSSCAKRRRSRQQFSKTY